MLHKSKVLLASCIEKMYDATCTITGVKQTVNQYGANVSALETLYENVRCHVSAGATKNAEDMEVVRKSEPVKKIFLDSSLDIPTGSSFTVSSDDGYITHYKNSSKPHKYECHQEIMVLQV